MRDLAAAQGQREDHANNSNSNLQFDPSFDPSLTPFSRIYTHVMNRPGLGLKSLLDARGD
jgi:hypothetical protein